MKASMSENLPVGGWLTALRLCLWPAGFRLGVSGDLEAVLDCAVASGIAVTGRHLILDALQIACSPLGNWGLLFGL